MRPQTSTRTSELSLKLIHLVPHLLLMFRLTLSPRIIEPPCLFFRFKCTPCSISFPPFVVPQPRRVHPAKLVSALFNFTPEAGQIRAPGHQAAPWNSGASVGIVFVCVKLHLQLAVPSMFWSGALLIRTAHRAAVHPRVVDPNRPVLVFHHCCAHHNLCCESNAPGDLSTKWLQMTNSTSVAGETRFNHQTDHTMVGTRSIGWTIPVPAATSLRDSSVRYRHASRILIARPRYETIEHLPMLIEAQGFWRQIAGQNQKHIFQHLGTRQLFFRAGPSRSLGQKLVGD